MSMPPAEHVDARLAELDALLRERLTATKPISQAEAMEFARNAYLRGYCDAQPDREVRS